MIVYSQTLREFQDHILSNDIGNIIYRAYQEATGRSIAQTEIDTWQNSLGYMENVLQDAEISEDVAICIEYHIPQSAKRIDFIIAGRNEHYQEAIIIVELKQWSAAEPTSKDGIVTTYFRGRKIETTHPSYQALGYKELLESYNQTIEQEQILITACAYLHNYAPDNILNNDFYKIYTDKAPLFLKPDALKLRSFITSHIKYGDANKLMYRIDEGRLKPSKNLVDKLNSMLQGNSEFFMIDEQKLVFEQAIALALKSQTANKQVLIIKGGAGTGKSVIAINLLVKFQELELYSQYVTRNTAPRDVYFSKLTGSFKKTYVNELFKGAGSYHRLETDDLDALIVDEAHRLTEKSGVFGHLGENQIKEIINASKFTIFFIDEDQKIELRDIGDIQSIQDWAKKFKAQTHILELNSQFRCGGSNNYLDWLEDILQMKSSSEDLKILSLNYDFQVIDDPQTLHNLIQSKNTHNKARLVAGFCWDWQSKIDSELYDIQIGNYQARWNLAIDKNLWILKSDSVSEVGCIHTCQGLEVDYIGVIIGDDLIIRNNQVITQADKRSKDDRSIRGWKSQMENNPQLTLSQLDTIIKNTYKTLMTRGQRGCYIYCTDIQTQQYFKNLIQQFKE
ncbi:MAG: DUF2075 domain-containing protein [Candidatus Saccharibacteria bacterium]|nr:DUF2075 domain-containing protein [Candidatus Saccharibacteria bacterium]